MEGELLVNDAPLQRSSFQRLSCYVLQRDVLLSSATVRETLMTAALLKLPRGMAYSEKVARVDGIIAELVSCRCRTGTGGRAGVQAWGPLCVATHAPPQGLEGCQNTMIGDELMGMKGISGTLSLRGCPAVPASRGVRAHLCPPPPQVGSPLPAVTQGARSGA